MSEVFSTSGESSDITAGPPPNLQGLFIPGMDNSQFVDGFGIVTPWGGGSTARRYGDYGISNEISRQSTQLNDLASSLTPAEGAGADYSFEGLVGPQGIPGRDGIDGISHLIVAPNSNFLAALPHNIDQINDLGTAADKLIYTSAYTTADRIAQVDLCSDSFAASSLNDLLVDYDDVVEVTFSSPVELTSGSKYAIVVRTSGPAELDWIEIGQHLSNVYANGLRQYSLDSGGSWIQLPTRDTYFITKAGGVAKDSNSGAVSSVASFYGTTWVAQSFIAGSTYTISSVELKLWKRGAATTGTVTVGIREIITTYSEATWAESALTSAGRAILDDATAEAQATTLGLGTGDSPEFTGLELSGGTITVGGAQVLKLDTTLLNTLVGEEAGNSLTGANNTFLGYRAGYSATDINNIVLLGHQAGYSLTSSITADEIRSVLIGFQAGYSLTTGEKSTVIGNQALFSETTGENSIAIGHSAGYNQVGSNACVLIGALAGYYNIDGVQNTYIGTHSGRGVETKSGNYNTAVGYRALYTIGTITTGADYNVAVGYEAGLNLTTGGDNVFVGTRAGRDTTDAQYNFALGTHALLENEEGDANVCIGHEAGKSTDGNSINYNALIGYRAGYRLTGNSNIMIGHQTGYDATTLHDSILIGYRAGYNLTTLDDNVMVGKDSGYTGTTADGCTYLGYQTGYTATDAVRRICIGHSAGFYDTNSDRFILDNQKRTNAAEEITNALMYGIMAAAPADQSLRINATFNINGKLTAGSFGSPIDVTVGGAYGFELHYSGNNYDVTGIRSRAQLVTTDTTATALGGLFQAANNDGINAGVLNGALIEAIGKSTANAATISTMRGALIGCEWGAFDTITALHGLHIRIHTLNNAGAGSFGTACALTIENEAVGGNGQVLTAGIQFTGTNLSAGNKAFDYGINFGNGVEYGSADMNLSAGEIHRAGLRFLKEDNVNYNMFFGTEVFNNDDGQNNVGIGYQAGYNNDTTGGGNNGKYNIYIGYRAGYGGTAVTNNTGYQNNAIGYKALIFNTSGYRNNAIGNQALYSNTTGYHNNAMGNEALYWNTFGIRNTAVGSNALNDNTSGDGNVGIGYRAGYNQTTGDYNLFLGYYSGYNQTAISNLLVIDNLNRGSAAAEITDCLIYGVFHATPASQTLRFNVGSITQGNPTHSDADGGGATQQIFVRQDGAGTETACAQIEASHDGVVANDQLGKMIFSVNTGAALAAVVEIDSSGNTKIGDAGVTNYTQFAIDGSLTFVGTAGLAYGEISVKDNAVATTLNSGAEVQLTVFDTNGPSNNTAPDQVNNEITITTAGYYLVTISIHVNNNAAQTHIVDVSLNKNNGSRVELTNVHGHRTLTGGSGDVGSMSLSGIVDLAVGDELQLWATTDVAADRSVTFEDITLSIIQIGGT